MTAASLWTSTDAGSATRTRTFRDGTASPGIGPLGTGDRAYGGGRPPSRDHFARAYVGPEPVRGYSGAPHSPGPTLSSRVSVLPKTTSLLTGSTPNHIAPG